MRKWNFNGVCKTQNFTAPISSIIHMNLEGHASSNANSFTRYGISVTAATRLTLGPRSSLPGFPAAQLVRVSRVVVTRESITLYETNSVIFTKPSFFSNSFNSIQLWVGVVSSTPECLCIEERIPTCSKFLLLAFIFTMFLIDITIIALFFGWQPKRTMQWLQCCTYLRLCLMQLYSVFTCGEGTQFYGW